MPETQTALDNRPTWLPTLEPRRASRPKTYRFVVDIEVRTDVLRHGLNPRAWPAAILRAHLQTALRLVGGHVQTRVTWISGYRREVSHE